MENGREGPDAFIRAITWFLWHAVLGLSPLIVVVVFTPINSIPNELYRNLINEGIISFFATVICGVVWLEFTFSYNISQHKRLVLLLAAFPALSLSFGIIAIWELHRGTMIDIGWHGPLQFLLFLLASAYSIAGKAFIFAEEIGTHDDLIECEKARHA